MNQPNPGSHSGAGSGAASGSGSGSASGNGQVGQQQRRRHGNQQRRKQAPRPIADFWHATEPVPELDRIVATPDPTALMRSLGELPINDDTSVRLQVATVVERAAAIAAALAHSADLLADPQR